MRGCLVISKRTRDVKAVHNMLNSILVCWCWLLPWAPELRLSIARTFHDSEAWIINHVLCVPVESIARNTFCIEASFDQARFNVELAPYLWSELRCCGIILPSLFTVVIQCQQCRPVQYPHTRAAHCPVRMRTSQWWSSHGNTMYVVAFHWTLIFACISLREIAHPLFNLNLETFQKMG